MSRRKDLNPYVKINHREGVRVHVWNKLTEEKFLAYLLKINPP